MKHVICYICNKLGHIAEDCRNKVRAPYQKEKTSSHLKIWKKKEVQSKRCGTAQYTDITDSEGAESVNFSFLNLICKFHEEKSRIYAS